MYPSDLQEKEWESSQPSVDGGWNSVCQWRMLPKEYPPWKTVYGYFRSCCQKGIWEKVSKRGIQLGRHQDPTLLILDAQSVKTSGKGEQRGFDGEGKKIKGRKRQILVDTQGLLHHVFVHPANTHDSKGGASLVNRVLKHHPKLKVILPDLGYRGLDKNLKNSFSHRTVSFFTKTTRHFLVQAQRWIVERTFAWLNCARRLSKDFEQKCYSKSYSIRCGKELF